MSTGGRRAILVIDDEAMLRRLYQRVLARAGYVVVEASSLAEAFALLARADLLIWMIITDWQLDDGTSDVLIEHVRGRQPELPIVCVSGSICDGVLDVPTYEKPLWPDKLLAVVKDCDDQSRG